MSRSTENVFSLSSQLQNFCLTRFSLTSRRLGDPRSLESSEADSAIEVKQICQAQSTVGASWKDASRGVNSRREGVICRSSNLWLPIQDWLVTVRQTVVSYLVIFWHGINKLHKTSQLYRLYRVHLLRCHPFLSPSLFLPLPLSSSFTSLFVDENFSTSREWLHHTLLLHLLIKCLCNCNL